MAEPSSSRRTQAAAKQSDLLGESESRWDDPDRYNNSIAILLLFPVMFVAKFLVDHVLGDKYFFDNNRILQMTLGVDTGWEGSYRVASDLFSKLNIFHFTTMVEWSTTLGVIFTFVLLILILRMPSLDLLQLMFLLASVGLLNIYVFNISKDIIQFSFFFAVYLVLQFPLKRPIISVALVAAILYYESTFFRSYYILIAAFVVGVYVLLLVFRRYVKRFSALTALEIVGCLFVMVFLALLVAQRVMPDEYKQVVSVRSDSTSIREGDTTASNTLITDLLPGSGLPGFMLNYVVNAFRMMIPVELLTKGAYYIPFFLFQCMVTVYIINMLRQINEVHDSKQFIAICVYIGYALGSFIFEPDFGSWVRHETATFPVLQLLVFSTNQHLSWSAMKSGTKAMVDKAQVAVGMSRG